MDAEFLPDQLKTQCAAGESQLWFVWSGTLDGAAVTTTAPSRRGPLCIIVAAGGKMATCLGFLDEIEKWAKSIGCAGIRIYGRKGWSRVLRDYKVTRFVYDKEI